MISGDFVDQNLTVEMRINTIAVTSENENVCTAI